MKLYDKNEKINVKSIKTDYQNSFSKKRYSNREIVLEQGHYFF